MCWAASFSMVSASSASLIEGSEIFFTITEWPLTAVATFFVLMAFSENSFEMALETVPESTIIESTTISGASGSRPRCATSMPVRLFFSSTALMLEEPTSKPTIDFDPNPNMCPPLGGSLAGRLRLSRPLLLGFRGLLFHPLVQPRFLETPAVAQLECRNLLLVDVLVERVRTHAQILRRLANVHDLARISHIRPFHRVSVLLCPPCRTSLGEESARKRASSGFWWTEHISTASGTGSRRISVFYRFLSLFYGTAA